MSTALRHRGPDSRGVFCDPDRAYAVAHRRLSVLDLSEAGHQPMIDPTGRTVIAYNGEIYNHRELRADLEHPPAWRGDSDTETLLMAIEAWGVTGALERARGMFAFALWDRETATLTLARDRLGEKPLYYGWVGGAFLFASELAALEAWPGFEATVDSDALAGLLRYGYVPAPRSIYRNIYKLEPGTVLTIQRSATASPPDSVPTAGYRSPGLDIRRWWSLDEIVDNAGPFDDEAEALETLHDTLLGATRLQLLSDVPLGAFLSGGIDSSLVVALMQAQGDRPVNTYTMGFEDAAFDEAPWAARIAAHLGTRHTPYTVTEADALEVVPELPRLYSEPFADASQIPTHLVARLARQEVTVALSGDGGDELFGGYNRYAWAPRAWRWLERLPAGLRGNAADGLALAGRTPALRGLLEALGGVAQAREKLAKLADRARHAHDVESFYAALAAVNPGAASLLVAAPAPGDRLDALVRRHPDRSIEERMMVADAMTYLPDDILCKVDRAAMAVSLETRVPYLDPDVVRCAWRLPLSMKLRNGTTKWALRQLLGRYLPAELMDQPKRGFAVPLDDWLRGPLRDWAEALLDPGTLAGQGMLDPAAVRGLWDAHTTGRGDHA
ncbi:MAG: asparagine synthase (glutamine-hydrolyzing), partial [Xanthomonadales bacterium]|nr:asparagine synthase (glutamine-hydrolyzing) [Xanthomonadales bacterium]